MFNNQNDLADRKSRLNCLNSRKLRLLFSFRCIDWFFDVFCCFFGGDSAIPRHCGPTWLRWVMMGVCLGLPLTPWAIRTEAAKAMSELGDSWCREKGIG